MHCTWINMAPDTQQYILYCTTQMFEQKSNWKKIPIKIIKKELAARLMQQSVIFPVIFEPGSNQSSLGCFWLLSSQLSTRWVLSVYFQSLGLGPDNLNILLFYFQIVFWGPVCKELDSTSKVIVNSRLAKVRIIYFQGFFFLTLNKVLKKNLG